MREGTCWHGDTGTRGTRNTRGPEAQRLGWPEEAELKGGTIGRPDDWLGIYIFGCRVTGTGIGSSGAGRSAIGSWHPGSGG